MLSRHALIAGATGIVGRRIAERLHANGWTVTGVCRRPPPQLPYRMLAVDLADARDCGEKLGALTTVTHVFYAARYDHPEGQSELVDVNAAMRMEVSLVRIPIGLQRNSIAQALDTKTPA